MGMDVLAYSLAPKNLDEALVEIGRRVPGEEFALVVEFDTDNWFVEWDTLHPYYGPGYERGHWTRIHEVLESMRATFGSVCYGSDASMVGELPEWTIADSNAMWDHWRSPHWDDYWSGS